MVKRKIYTASKASAEELYAFWRGDRKTYLKLYNLRKKAELDATDNLVSSLESNGTTITYNPKNNELDEVIITAKGPSIIKKVWDNTSTDDKIDAAITTASFIPGLDTAADIADSANLFRQGNWGWGLLGLGATFVPGLSMPYIRKGIEGIKYLKNNVRLTLPKANYYRVLSDLDKDKVDDAVLDLLSTGIVRSNPKGTYKIDGTREKYIGPYFYKNKPFKSALNKSSKVLVSNSEKLDWLPILPHETILKKSPESTQFTPLFNGVPNTAPTSEFELWERGDNFITRNLWFKKSLPNKEIEVEPFNYPDHYNMVIHTDFGNNKGTFGKGAYINESGILIPGTNPHRQTPYIWFNENKPYAMGVNGNPVTRVIVGNKSKIDGLLRVRDMKVPVGLWDGNSGFVLKSEMVTPKPLNMKDLLLFEWNPSLGRYLLKKKGGKL